MCVFTFNQEVAPSSWEFSKEMTKNSPRFEQIRFDCAFITVRLIQLTFLTNNPKLVFHRRRLV